jgi:excisionase family DNA binding protein
MGSIAPKSDALRQALANKKKEVEKPVLLTITEACDCLRVSRHTIYRLLNERKLPSIRILSRRLIPLAAIEAFIAAQAAGAA